MLFHSTLTLGAILALSVASQTQAAELSASEIQNEVEFVERAAALDPQVLAPTPGATEEFLGRVSNQSTGQSVEIYCTSGPRTACKELSFFRVNGVRADTAFKRITVGALDAEVKNPKYHFPLASDWLLHPNEGDRNRDEEAEPLFFLVGVGEAVLITDVLLIPFRLVGRWISAPTYKNARLALYKTLTTGGTVPVNDRQFGALLKLLTE
jgi:hypothetical protein